MNEPHDVAVFVTGALCAGYVLAGLFFLRFWAQSRDRFFAAFAVAFWLMAINQVVAGLEPALHGEDSRAYLLRLLAYVVIIAAVLDKNVGDARPRK